MCFESFCKNNGICLNLINYYYCDCVVGFNGINCEIGKNFLYNISFVLSCKR